MRLTCEPKSVFGFFERISAIPRGSGNEKGISDWLVAFAKEKGLWVHQDKALNVIVKKPGTAGFENVGAVILQAHMDMVCEKNVATEHDFEKDPIRLVVEGDFIRAEGTTLGADNGAALAMILALLDSADIPHPPLEVLVTTGEEVGLLGAAEVDGEMFGGKSLLNLDSGEEGFFCVCCAGGARVDLSFEMKSVPLPDGFIVKNLNIKGLKGGHSGVDITKERGNGIRLMARALKILHGKFDILFVFPNGGAKDNAIPREAEVGIAFPKAKEEEFAAEVGRIEKTFKDEYAISDEGFEMSFSDRAGFAGMVYHPDDAARVMNALLLLPNGVQAMNLVLKDLPETSMNIGVISSSEDRVSIGCSLRSSVASRKEMLLEQVNAVAEATCAKVKVSGVYPAWEYRRDSALREMVMGVFAEMFGREALICGTHGGLECGLLSQKIDGVDIVSFGPDIYEMHTPNERMSISSFARTWDFLLKLLERLGSR